MFKTLNSFYPIKIFLNQNLLWKFKMFHKDFRPIYQKSLSKLSIHFQNFLGSRQLHHQAISLSNSTEKWLPCSGIVEGQRRITAKATDRKSSTIFRVFYFYSIIELFLQLFPIEATLLLRPRSAVFHFLHAVLYDRWWLSRFRGPAACSAMQTDANEWRDSSSA